MKAKAKPGARGLTDAQMVKALKALGDGRRFRMVQEIAAAGELSCTQIGELFALSQPTISHHLKLLTDSGLIVTRNEAQHHYISINREVLDAMTALLPTLLSPQRASEAKARKAR